MSAPIPKMPNPDQILEVTNKQITQSIDLINAQMAEVTTTLGLPSIPLPKLTPPALPKLGAPGGFPTLPTMPFGEGIISPMRKGEETITRTVAPTPQRAVVLA